MVFLEIKEENGMEELKRFESINLDNIIHLKHELIQRIRREAYSGTDYNNKRCSGK
jgi:hypothetical protein